MKLLSCFISSLHTLFLHKTSEVYSLSISISDILFYKYNFLRYTISLLLEFDCLCNIYVILFSFEKESRGYRVNIYCINIYYI